MATFLFGSAEGVLARTHYRHFDPLISGVRRGTGPNLKYNPLHSKTASRPPARALRARMQMSDQLTRNVSDCLPRAFRF